MKFKFIKTRFQSICQITNESGEILHTTDTLAYGEELTAPYEDTNDKVLNTITYTGHEKDYETNLTYMLARYYSQGYGRFLSPDPGYDYDQLDPMSWNLYAYVRGNPVNYDDPSGMVVNVKGLTEDEQQQLISDLQKITGYKDISVNKDGNLQIGSDGEYEGGSKTARKLLSNFINSDKVVHVLSAEQETKRVRSGGQGSPFTSNLVMFGRALGNTISIDFGDFKANLIYRNFTQEEKFTHSIGLTFFHEIGHAFFNYPDKNKQNPLATTVGMCNVIRRELGLPERRGYSYYSKQFSSTRNFIESYEKANPTKRLNGVYAFENNRFILFSSKELRK